jgi:hypothetical protein
LNHHKCGKDLSKLLLIASDINPTIASGGHYDREKMGGREYKFRKQTNRYTTIQILNPAQKCDETT